MLPIAQRRVALQVQEPLQPVLIVLFIKWASGGFPSFRALNLQQKGQKEALLYLCPVVCAISHSTEGQTESSIPCLRSESFQDGLPLSFLRAASSSLPTLQGAQVNTESAAPTGVLRPDPHSAQDSRRWASSAGLGTDTPSQQPGHDKLFRLSPDTFCHPVGWPRQPVSNQEEGW